MGAPPFPAPVAVPKFREGHGWKSEEIDKWIIAGGHSWIMLDGRLKHENKTEGYIMSDVDLAYVTANKAISDARSAYDKTLQSFRDTIRNDLTAISASANRVQNETAKMHQAYMHAIAMFSSQEMASAIVNAERLATALQAISAVQSNSITFAVLEKKVVPGA